MSSEAHLGGSKYSRNAQRRGHFGRKAGPSRIPSSSASEETSAMNLWMEVMNVPGIVVFAEVDMVGVRGTRAPFFPSSSLNCTREDLGHSIGSVDRIFGSGRSGCSQNSGKRRERNRSMVGRGKRSQFR